MARAVELYVAIVCLLIGFSHLLRSRDWVAFYTILHRAGTPGAFANGFLSLVTGAIIVAGHWVWSWPELVITLLGCAMLVKSAICFLLPQKGVESMSRGLSPHGYPVAGAVLILISSLAAFCFWKNGA
ncbi:MAG TPA: hypothetical protein VGJ04_00630 [Pirellulales bacterium]|jgi:hypothetical protein